MIIDVACTATRRPDILEKTFSSFREKLFKDYKCRLVINLDPIGEVVNNEKIIGICNKYFDDVNIHTPAKPNFIKAWNWVFSNCTSKYIFHLQDDWELILNQDLNEMIWYLNSYDELACIRLTSRKSKDSSKFLDNKIYINKLYFDHPALWKLQFYKEILPYFDINHGTEYQLRCLYSKNSEEIKKIIENWYFGFYKNSISVLDIGRKWMDETNFIQIYDDNYLTGWRINRNLKNKSINI